MLKSVNKAIQGQSPSFNYFTQVTFSYLPVFNELTLRENKDNTICYNMLEKYDEIILYLRVTCKCTEFRNCLL